MNRLKLILTVLMLYITVAGLATFSLFILEESFQTVMFGTWPAQDAKRWDIVKTGTDLMRTTTRTMRILNYAAGWIQPIAFISYRSYALSADYYVSALTAKVFANAPHLYKDQNVDFIFTPRKIKTLPNNSTLLTAGKIGVIVSATSTNNTTTYGTLNISGILKQHGNLWVVDMRQRN